MSADGIVIKGTQDGLQVTLGEGPLDGALAELNTRLAEKAGFFEGARVIVQAGLRSLTTGDLTGLQALLAQHNMLLWAVLSEADETRTVARQLGLATRLSPHTAPGTRTAGAEDEASGPRPGAVPAFMRDARGTRATPGAPASVPNPAPLAVAAGPDLAGESEATVATAPEAPAGHASAIAAVEAGLPGVPLVDDGVAGVFVRRTLRSGKSLRYPGAVVVIGDVNPGAEIVAGGDVIVWGKLRGVVHAGAMGDEQAVVCALEMAPTQLRIAGRIAIAPEEQRKRKPPVPEMARIRNGQIVAEGWTPKSGRE